MLTDSLRAEIAERKQELLKFLRSNERAGAFTPPPILRRTINEPAPLSFAQERLWFLEQLEPGSTVYNICRAYRLTGKLNLPALEGSLSEIVRRHEVLRSSICVTDGRPVQIVQPAFELKISVVDLQAMSDVDREPEIRHRIRQAAEEPFDFAAGKFLRGELLRVRKDEHILILITHHIVSDAWSMGILTLELWSLYEAFALGKSSPFNDLPIQYADFAVWQRQWLQGDVLETQVSYWKKQVKELPILNLPTDRPRPARQSFQGARVPITLAEPLSAAINELSTQCGVTPFMTLLAAFQVLLHHYSGQEDVVVGSPIANRSRTETEPLIGFFVNTLVLHADLSGSLTFKGLLARVREVCLGAYRHQDLPFERLVHELQPERDQSRNPLFQVMFVLQNATTPFSQPQGMRIDAVEFNTDRSQLDLSLFLRERDGQYIGYFDYSTHLFDRSTIERMSDHFRTLLEVIVADCDPPVSTLPLLTAAERHQLLVEWNDTAADYPKDKCIHELFEEQVEKTPDAIAIVFDRQQLTYRELNTRANQLAHYLRGLGVGPERLVGICVERSLEMVVGLFGIVKAGGAYVPLDPAYPSERLAFMLEDAQLSVIVTQEKLRECGQHVAVSHHLTHVYLDRDWPVIQRESVENLHLGPEPENLAYVIYTSGSTGQPKGASIEHRNTINFLHWAKTVYTPQELEGVLASTSICFDLSVFELFAPLSWGGKVVLVENVLCLLESPAAKEVTLVNTVPSVMAALLSGGRLPDSVRTVNLAGEPLRPELVKQIYDLGTVKRIYDLYGPSESTTYSTFTLRTLNDPATIGHPIWNTQVYILDPHLQPTPIGVPGEIYIGGAGVARGYLNQPELTHERFIPDLFSDELTARLYRTGDSARYLSDGRIEFLGRTDNQVKIHGYRIELGEIEAALNQHPAVKESVVVARTRDSLTEESFVSYFVPIQQLGPSIGELRVYLRDKLPEYMIPSVFVMLDRLPLMPNGKVDRNALLAREGGTPELKRELTETRTEVEQLVLQIWRHVLKSENIGVYDNFFEVGGHSLLATEIISRLRDALDREIPLSLLFDSPTVADLSAEVEKLLKDGAAPALPPIVPVSRNGPLPLSMNQEHLWRLNQMMAGTHFFNMPYVYRLSGLLDIQALEKAVREIVRRHEVLRTVFAELDGSPVQVIKPNCDFCLPIMDLRTASGNDPAQIAADLIVEERHTPFDLAVGPLFRIKVLRLSEKEQLLLITMHHIISDERSMKVFRRELTTLYQAFNQERSSPLREVDIQFADFAVWERKLLGGGFFDAQTSYWKKQLAAPLKILDFQRSERAEAVSFRTASHPIEVDEAIFRSMLTLSRKENCTPAMVFLSALNVLVQMLTGGNDIRIGILVANRRSTSTESVIGHIMNTLVLRTHLSPGMTFWQLLQQVRMVMLAGYGHQELPFESLARAMENEEGIERSAIFQVLLVYSVDSFSTQELTGLTFAPFTVKSFFDENKVTISMLDLIFEVKQTATKLSGAVNYKTNLVDATIVKRINGKLNYILDAALETLDKCISTFSLDSR